MRPRSLTEARWQPLLVGRADGARVALRGRGGAAAPCLATSLPLDTLDQPLRWRSGRRVLVSPGFDIFDASVLDEWLDRLFAVMALARQHVFVVETEHPERMRDYLADPSLAEALRTQLSIIDEPGTPPFEWPLPNVLLGVRVQDQATADARVPVLLQCPAALRWVCAAPLRGPIALGAPATGAGHSDLLQEGGLGWVVAAGGSGPGARPVHPVWVQSLRDQCTAAGLPFLLRHWGDYVSADHVAGGMNFCYDHSRLGGWVSPNGDYSLGESSRPMHAGAAHIFKVGKHRAGRLLDGVVHDEYPTAACPAGD